MSDFQMYHALGSTPSNPDQNQNEQQQRNLAPQFRPPIAPSPTGYQQSGSFTGSQNQYIGSHPTSPAGYNAHGHEQGHFSPQAIPSPPGDGAQSGTDGLTTQMGAMRLGHGQVPHRKKKDRHAYHQLESPAGSSQAFNGIPQAHIQPSQFLNQTTSPQGMQAPFASPTGQYMGGAAQPQAPPPGTAVSSTQGRVDPEQIPSIPVSRDEPARYYLEHVYPTMELHLPPPSSIPFVSFDQGNSAPKFARLTLNAIPYSQENLTATALPLGLILQPLAKLQEGEQPIPLLDFGDQGPPRCRRCRTYVNPFMTFKSGGNKFVCNMCTFPNDVPPEYFAPTDPTGARVDRLQRAELCRGTVEFTVPKEYWAKEPVGLRWLFLIDVSAEAANKGFMDGICEGIMSALYGRTSPDQAKEGEVERRLPEGSKIGIVTYDKELHFYNLSSGLEKAQMMVMPDIEDPFVPLSEGLFVDPYESQFVISSLLTQLPSMFVDVKNPEPALLSALNACLAALEKTGGKIIASLAALPTWGPGRLFLRDDPKAHGTEAEKKLYTTEHPGWRKTAVTMVEKGVGVDFFMAAPQGGFLDIATVGALSSASGGEVYYYPNFHSPRDVLRLSKEITHTISRDTGFQALMKVRCSNGLQVSAYHGNFTHHTFGADLEFGVIDSDKAIAVLFSYDGKLDAKLDAHFQSALLYTTASGERRVRCCNLVASVTEGIGDVMRYVDQDAVISVIAKEAAARVPERTLKEVRSALSEKAIDILAGYRKSASGSNPPGQLVLPENLKEFSMYMLGLLKSRAFKAGREPTDRRVHDLKLIRSMGPGELSLYLYPRIYPLHGLVETDGFPNANGHLSLPSSLRASFSKIEPGGAYLVDNGQIVLLWLHEQVSPNLLEDLFGEGFTSLKSLDPFMNTLPVLETHLNAQVRNILSWLEENRGSKAVTLQLARQSLDGAEHEFARLLLEDRNNEAQSYVDWLVHLHRGIQLELAGQRKKEDEGDSMTGMASTLAGLRTPYWG